MQRPPSAEECADYRTFRAFVDDAYDLEFMKLQMQGEPTYGGILGYDRPWWGPGEPKDEELYRRVEDVVLKYDMFNISRSDFARLSRCP